jgi:cysteine desulfurase
MLPTFDSLYGNAGSITHEIGLSASDLVEDATATIGNAIGCKNSELVMTSGATESNNLAIYGYCLRRRTSGHIITVATEHKAVLDPLAKLQKRGFEITYLPVKQAGDMKAGLIDLDQFADAVRDDTFFASVMLANNEIGVIQPLKKISSICRDHDIVLHTDATQAIGNLPVDVNDLDVDLLSLSAHKFYGPKGVGALYVRQSGRRIRLSSQIDGGGQQHNRRSGTLNVSGIVGMARAIELCLDELESGANDHKRDLRDRIHLGLSELLGDIPVNGPSLVPPEEPSGHSIQGSSTRLSGNLNCQFPGIDGNSLMTGASGVAMSSGSACTAAEPEPSHVLKALGLNEDQVRSSIRLGIGRFNTADEIENAVGQIADTVQKLRKMN